MNNQVTMMPVSIENHIDDPLRRLRSISSHSKAAKGDLEDLGDAVVVTDFGGPFVPAQLENLARVTAGGGFAAFGDEVPMNLVVSNVPGLTSPIYLAGARVIGSMPCSIVTHGSGLNVTVTSYLDRMDLGLTAARSVVGDVQALRDDFDAAYAALVEVVLGQPVVAEGLEVEPAVAAA